MILSLVSGSTGRSDAPTNCRRQPRLRQRYFCTPVLVRPYFCTFTPLHAGHLLSFILSISFILLKVSKSHSNAQLYGVGNWGFATRMDSMHGKDPQQFLIAVTPIDTWIDSLHKGGGAERENFSVKTLHCLEIYIIKFYDLINWEHLTPPDLKVLLFIFMNICLMSLNGKAPDGLETARGRLIHPCFYPRK